MSKSYDVGLDERELSEKEFSNLGRDIKKFLLLKENKTGEVQTIWGKKSNQGLGRSIIEIINQSLKED